MQFKVGKETMQYPNYLQVIPASVEGGTQDR